MRDALVRLASWLAQSPDQRAYLVLVDPVITDSSLEAELAGFKAALRRDIARRLELVVVRDGDVDALPPGMTARHWTQVAKEIGAAEDAGRRLPRADMQSEVLRMILLHWYGGGGAMTSEWLSDTVGCSYRTVAEAVKRLGPAVERQRDRSIRLKYFPKDAWAEFIAVSSRARGTIHYIDRSGNPRSMESLVRRLRGLHRDDVAVGGVPGATYHCPDLNITGTPRLDLCIHAPGKAADIDFMETIDPGLERTDDPYGPVRVALHFLRRDNALFSRDAQGHLWADPVECLADLHEARLEQTAVTFREFIARHGETLGGRG